MLVVNLCGGASCGKSRTRAGLFHLLKFEEDMVCEEAIEQVKQEVYAKNTYIFTDQLLILAQQAAILKQLNGQVKVAVSDSPLFLSSIYAPDSSPAFHKVVSEEFNRFNNLNIVLQRVNKFQPVGRHGTEEDAKQKDNEVVCYMKEQGIPYFVVKGDFSAPNEILKLIKAQI